MLQAEVFLFSQPELSLVYHQRCYTARLAVAACIQVERQELGSTLGWRGWSGSGRRVQGGALGAGAHPEPGPRAARERAQGCVPCGGSVRECGHAAVCEQGTCAPRVPKCHRIQKDGSKPREG